MAYAACFCLLLINHVLLNIIDFTLSELINVNLYHNYGRDLKKSIDSRKNKRGFGCKLIKN